jgi:hypothetical protein
MERAPEVKLGPWRNYAGTLGSSKLHVRTRSQVAEQQSGDQYTVSKSVDTALQLFIGLCFGAASPVFCDILVRLWEWARFWCTAEQRQDDEEAQLLDEGQRDLDEGQAPGAQGNARRPDQGWARVITWTILVIGFIGYSVGSSLSAAMPAGSSGLSASEHCGPYGLRSDAGAEAQDKDDLFQAKKEGEARQYGRDCYGHSSLAIPDHCNFFVGQAIPYDVHLEQECPFKDINLCPGGGYTAARFTTGLVDASLLGINAEKAPKFNRTLICVPLDMNQGFIKEIPPDSQHHDYRYEYHLGPVSGSEHHSDYTFRTLGDPFKWDMPGYSMR